MNLIFIFIFIISLHAAILNYDWEIKEGLIAPDNFAIKGILINNQFPGPTINCTVGDTLIIKVRNRLHKDFSIHWHGIAQMGTVRSDGVPYVTQPPIKPGNDFVYSFNVHDQSGTWWYHAHTGLDSEHAYGALIVHDKKEIWNDVVQFDSRYNYDDERVFLISELWHKPVEELLKGLLELPFRFVGSSDSILTNGMTYQIWDNNGKDNSTVPFNFGYNVINVKPNKRYRFRIIAANGLSSLTFRIPGHKFTLIEADGTIIEPIEVDRIEMAPGQRYSIIVKTDQPINNYYIYTQLSNGSTNPNNGVAILHYEGASNPENLRHKVQIPPNNLPSTNRWVESQLFTSKWYNKGLSSHYYPVPKKINKEIILNVIPAVNEGHSIFTVNDVIVKPRNNTIWDDILANRFKPIPGIYEIEVGQEVQIIVQHFMPPGRSCQAHPWHLHGHSFFVVDHGNGVYNPNVDHENIDEKINCSNKIPVYRDTFIHFPNDVQSTPQSSFLADAFGIAKNNENSDEDLYSIQSKASINADVDTPVPCGWYAIRFKANNRGVWIMHCHITAHLVMGKQLIINEVPKKNHCY